MKTKTRKQKYPDPVEDADAFSAQRGKLEQTFWGRQAEIKKTLSQGTPKGLREKLHLNRARTEFGRASKAYILLGDLISALKHQDKALEALRRATSQT